GNPAMAVNMPISDWRGSSSSRPLPATGPVDGPRQKLGRVAMRFVAVLNRDVGSLRTIDLEAFSRRLEQLLREQGHEIRIVAVPGSGIVKALESEAGRRDIDVVLAGGGDGTISAAASVLAGKATALAVLPAGTM